MNKRKGFTPLEIKISNRGSNRRSERFLTGFTLLELLVVIGIIALLMAVLMPALRRAREQGKRSTCLSYLKQLTLAWAMYADDNDSKIVNGARGQEGCVGGAGPGNPKEWPWVCDDLTPMWDNPPNMEKAIRRIKSGALYKYTKDIKLYKCPTGQRGWVRTYSLVDSMNAGYAGVRGFENMVIKNRLQITRPGERFVFIDESAGRVGITSSGWSIYYAEEKWYDSPPKNHNKGATFSYADGHSGYRKWKDKRTLDLGKHGDAQPGNVDLHWCQKGVWGKLGYDPTPVTD